MTSSATQTSTGRKASAEQPADGSRDRLSQFLADHIETVLAGGLFVVGAAIVLFVNRWHIGPPVVFLLLGWAAILASGATLWRAALTAAREAEGVPADEGFELSESRRQELEREKKNLLKAIKDVEFDQDMGKMSEADAQGIIRAYRGRAIEILKQLDGSHGDELDGAPIDVRIEQDLKARLTLAGVKPVKARTPHPESGTSHPGSGTPHPDPPPASGERETADTATESDTESDTESATETETETETEKRS